MSDKDRDLESLISILNDSENSQVAQRLALVTGKAQSTIEQIKKGAVKPRYSVIKILLRGCEKI